MKLGKTQFYLPLALGGLVLASCSKEHSNTTGWSYNDRENGGFEVNLDYEGQQTGPGLVFIEGGNFVMGQVEEDFIKDWNNQPRRVTVSSFYLDQNEVTNVDYREYLYWLERVYAPDLMGPEYEAIKNFALPDTLVWRRALAYNELYVENYLRHPAYNFYPVVGVSWIQAVEFANWRSDRVNEFNLEKAGYLKRDAKITDVNADQTFSTDTYINAPSLTYGGNDSIINPEKSRRRVQTTATGDTINVNDGTYDIGLNSTLDGTPSGSAYSPSMNFNLKAPINVPSTLYFTLTVNSGAIRFNGGEIRSSTSWLAGLNAGNATYSTGVHNIVITVGQYTDVEILKIYFDGNTESTFNIDIADVKVEV